MKNNELLHSVEEVFKELPEEISCMKPFIKRVINQHKGKSGGIIRTELVGEERDYFSTHLGRVILEDLLGRIKFPAQKMTIGSMYVTMELI